MWLQKADCFLWCGWIARTVYVCHTSLSFPLVVTTSWLQSFTSLALRSAGWLGLLHFGLWARLRAVHCVLVPGPATPQEVPFLGDTGAQEGLAGKERCHIRP